MHNDLLNAKKILDSGINVVLSYNGMILTNNKEASIAINEFILSQMDFTMFTLGVSEIKSDIVSLIIDLGVKSIITYKLSDIAKELLEKNDVKCSYKELINELEN